ncbi:MAG: PIN domain-containing protein [Pirellulaceae bacterium]
MKIYFDNCSLHRPFDNKAQLRVALEAEAVLGVLAVCEAGKAILVSSEVLRLENERDPQPQGRAFVSSTLDQATALVTVNEDIRNRAQELKRRGFKAFDALHVACAEAGEVDYFCTCDDRLLKKSRGQSDLLVKVVSPLELANEISP